MEIYGPHPGRVEETQDWTVSSPEILSLLLSLEETSDGWRAPVMFSNPFRLRLAVLSCDHSPWEAGQKDCQELDALLGDSEKPYHKQTNRTNKHCKSDIGVYNLKMRYRQKDREFKIRPSRVVSEPLSQNKGNYQISLNVLNETFWPTSLSFFLFQIKSIETFAMHICEHFLSSFNHVTRAHVYVEEAPWKRFEKVSSFMLPV